MRALVTGAAGFVGSHLVDALRGRGDDVVALDDLSKGRRERLADVELVVCDIRDAEALQAAFDAARPERVFHLAAQADVRVSVSAPAVDAAINVAGTINVLEAARSHDAAVIFASTGGALYGDTHQLPTPEDAPIVPEAPYGTAKLCAEHYLELWNRLHASRHAALRFGNIYGPRQDPHGEAGVVSILAGRVLADEPLMVFGDGTQTRDYVYVADAVAAFLSASDAGRAGRWNVGTGIQTSVLDLVDGLGAVAGRSLEPTFAPARPGELRASSLDGSAAARDLGFRPLMPLLEGLRRVYAWVEAGEPARGPS